jgi:hypothetical protein
MDMTVDPVTDKRLKNPSSIFFNLQPLTGQKRIDFLATLPVRDWQAQDTLFDGDRHSAQVYVNAYMSGGPFYQFDSTTRVGTGQFHTVAGKVVGIGGLSDAQFAALSAEQKAKIVASGHAL